MRRCEVNVLVLSIYETLEKGKLNELIAKVYNHLKNVLVLIVEVNGENELVESKRGKKIRNLDMSIEQLNNIHNDNEDEDAIYDSI